MAERSAIGVIREILTGYLHGRGEPVDEVGRREFGRKTAAAHPVMAIPIPAGNHL
jgi:hypothetical protein